MHGRFNKKIISPKIKRDLQLYIIYAAFLSSFLLVLSIYKSLILRGYAIDYFHVGYCFIEGLILAKIILIGQYFEIGARSSNLPLIYSTFYNTVIFCLFAFAFDVFEHLLFGLYRGYSLYAIYFELIGRGVYIILTNIFIMFFVYFLLFAFIEINRELGDRKLYELFFVKRNN